MSLTIFQTPGISSAAHQRRCDHLFNKYGPALYGYISKAANMDADSADRILVAVFRIIYTGKGNCAGNDRAAFIQLMQMMIRMMNKEGYQPCLPFMRPPSVSLQQLG
jgi:hypothetical protein